MSNQTSLPVVQPRGLRPRRPSLWRTLTLIAVHLLIIGHVAQWLHQGVTVSPVEPSEGMELAKHGIVNTGLVFFVAAIVVTAVFGRFFCGWGCHLVALQDLSRWILIKLGLKPRPLRSRLLGLVPLIAFAYMFLWPAVYKMAVGQGLGPIRVEMTTADFWATFPGLAVAVVTFVICGFGVVFVLGSKGYCTYGCPYGAAFGLADRLAPIRVRVTDACAGCATCTSVCTSNVRVHEEVREHGTVVDPGCMKCLDCVANCPNDALYVGVGRPAVGTKPSRRGPGSLSLPEELLAVLIFVVGFVVFRGLYSAVPFLLTLGLAGVYAGIGVAAVRLARRHDVWFGPLRLKAAGRLRRAGRVFLTLAALAVLFWVHSAAIRLVEGEALARFTATTSLRRAALDLVAPAAALDSEQASLVIRAARMEALLHRISPVVLPEARFRRAWLAYLEGNLERAGELIDEALADRPDHSESHLLAARMLVQAGRLDDAAAAYARVVELAPFNPAGHLGLGVVLGQGSRIGEALEVFRAGLTLVPDSVDLRYNLGLSLALSGNPEAAIGVFEDVLAVAPDHRPARENLAGMLAATGRFVEAAAIFEEAVRRSPDDVELRIMAARACIGAGIRDRAEVHVETAIELDPSLEWARRLLDGIEPGLDSRF